ncbi:divergent PAP2 family protein [Alicyclobacillaceae bacterium I2511]|nr:divergent PAP2 family protein [Alicyclobacillaceae bacterium I2511]
MDFLEPTLNAYIWIAPLVAMVAAQVLKPLLIMLRLRRLDWQRMRQSGGMPSSHTALVTALVTELWLRQGGQDPVVAIAVFVAIIVMYDAAGVRWQTGRHAAVLNRLLNDLKVQQQTEQGRMERERIVQQMHPLPVVKVPWFLVDWPILDEHVGHKPSEVLGGCVVGFMVALLLH